MSQVHDLIKYNGYFGAATGQLDGVSALNIFGFNRAVGTTFETVWNGTSAFTLPTTETTLSVVSSSLSDTMTVLIQGVDANYSIVTEIVTLNGTTPVSTTSNFMRVNNAVILSGNNVGNISISHGATLVGYIEAEIGTTQACAYTVPAGHTFYLVRIDLTSGTVNPNKYITYRNRIQSSSGRVLRVAESTWSDNQQSLDRQVPFEVAEKNAICFEAKSSSGENEVSIFLEGILVED